MKFFVLTLSLLSSLAAHALINGTVRDPVDFPANKYARSGNSACSSTLVGPEVLKTAAHCVRDGGTMTFSHDGKTYQSRCTHHRDYDFTSWLVLDAALTDGVPFKEVVPRRILTTEQLRNATADWALCKVSAPVTGLTYETFARDPKLLVKGGKLLLAGFGCTNPGGGGGNDGKYRTGQAEITDLPGPGQDHDIVTRGGGALCFGDSGGEAAVQVGQTEAERLYVGVNSRGDIRRMSYLPAVTQPTFQEFAEKWSSDNGVKLCGYHSDLQGCRGVTPPVPPKEVTVVGRTVTLKATLNESAKYSVETARAALATVLKDLDALP